MQSHTRGSFGDGNERACGRRVNVWSSPASSRGPVKWPSESTRIGGITQNPTESNGIPRNQTESNGIPPNPRNPTESTESHGIKWNPMESHRIHRIPPNPRNPMESRRISDDSESCTENRAVADPPTVLHLHLQLSYHWNTFAQVRLQSSLVGVSV